MQEKKNSKQIRSIIISLVVLVVACAIGIGFHLFEDVKDVLKNRLFSVSNLISLAAMVSLVYAIEKAVDILLGYIKVASHRANTILTISRSLLKYAGALIMICWGLSILGVSVSTIAASVGIITLVVGFGAESLIADVITGVFMLFENQYNVGDIVEVNGFRGTVSDIGIRTTSITDAGGNVKIFNNSNMKDILNRSDNLSRSVCDIQIPYEVDLEQFEQKIDDILEKIYTRHTDVMNAKPTYLGVQELAESGVTLRFVAEVAESNIYGVQRILNRDLYIAFHKVGVEVPYPQVDVHQK